MKFPQAFPELEAVRQRMGAPLSSWPAGIKEQTPIEIKIIDSNLRNILPIGPGGPLAYQGQQIVLYIKRPSPDRDSLRENPEKFPRFHIAECTTIEKMRETGRFERYVAINLTYYTNAKGLFNVTVTDKDSGNTETIQEKLHVCKNCLNALELFHDLSNWPEFSILDFFRNHETFFHSLPEHTDITAPPGGYSKNWRSLSEKYRNSVGWKCEECGVKLADNRSLLHAHHIDGDIRNDKPEENLRALCVECHYQQPWHGLYPPRDEERAKLHQLRTAQRLLDR